ncbi:SAM-dependent DNA methyltransferase [Komagataeibacter sp. AV436]|uniref:site-specific DNA-methyltransferase (adenine-specific) n=1 Tax=Komagataeibacter melomenusus TaxID=2766578 RepID=A0ABX2A8Q8_9PROT|nr:class I SAM-dependent DNA methyltransferase [Komagataeibacter melomenusus]MBV1829305.1 type I restriction-modification system subunit M [Komagataeibacter melomenusus]NPC64876.1 SAM-dependent DNA methyltransferase [Komagataeibacter melomenusus]
MTAPLLSATAIWRIAGQLRRVLPPVEYGPAILAFTMLRRLEQARPPAKGGLAAIACAADPLRVMARQLERLPAAMRAIMAQLEVDGLARRLAAVGMLGPLAAHFAALDLSPALYGSEAMAQLFEELVSHFTTTQGTGTHYTPPEVADLMVDLVCAADAPGTRLALYDPAAGTGALLARAADRLRARGVMADLYGQELNAQSCALARADLLLRGLRPRQVVQGDTLLADGHARQRFGRMLANPPFGLDWRSIRAAVQAEHAQGAQGRFAPGLPRVSDGSMLFVLHLLAKMRAPRHGGSRIGVVTHGAALNGGGVESGESAIRRYLVEHDLIDTVIALPQDMFINTGIGTYVWVLDNSKPAARRGLVSLVNAAALWRRCGRSQGEKRREMTQAHVTAVVQAALEGAECDLDVRDGPDGAPASWRLVPPEGGVPLGRRTGFARQVPARGFLYRSLSVTCMDHAGAPTRMVFTTGMETDPQAWFDHLVAPHDPTARLDHARAGIGCAISFARYFDTPEPSRPLPEIEADLRASMARLAALMPGGMD